MIFYERNTLTQNYKKTTCLKKKPNCFRLDIYMQFDLGLLVRLYYALVKPLKKRITLHNNGKGAKFTKGRKWKLIYSKKFSSKILAMKYENALKNDKKKRSLIKLKNLSK